MPPCLQVVQCVEGEIEALVPLDIELSLLDVGMVGYNPSIRVELVRDLLGDLCCR